jgi:hypothetical protein
MYALQYNQITYPESSVRFTCSGLSTVRSRSQMLDDNYSGFLSMCGAKRRIPWFTILNRRACGSTQFSRSASFGMPTKCWGRLWKKLLFLYKSSITSLVSCRKITLLFCRAIMRSLFRIPWEWRTRSHCLGFRDALYKTARTDFSSYLEPVLKIFELPQFHMGADPIIMSAIKWQGCHCSNHGGK